MGSIIHANDLKTSQRQALFNYFDSDLKFLNRDASS